MKDNYKTSEEVMKALGYEMDEMGSDDYCLREEAVLKALSDCFYIVDYFSGTVGETRVYDDKVKAMSYAEDCRKEIRQSGDYVNVVHKNEVIMEESK